MSIQASESIPTELSDWRNQPHQVSPDGLAYWKFGEEGVPVLLVMGFGMPGIAWEPQIDGLLPHHPLAFYDHLGLGKSRALKPRESRSMTEMAHHALSLMDHLGWETAHIVGVSMGGMISQHIALQAPERVRSLTLIATSPGGLLAPLPKLEGIRGFWKVNSAKDLNQRLKAMQSLLFPPEYLARQDRAEWSFVPGKAAPAETRLAHLRAVVKHNLRRRLRKLPKFPTLIVRPGKDILVPPRESDRLKRLLPHAEILDIPDGGHGVMRQHAATINQKLLEHFQKADATR